MQFFAAVILNGSGVQTKELSNSEKDRETDRKFFIKCLQIIFEEG